MPQSYSTRAGTKGARAAEKKLAKQAFKAPKEKFQRAKAAILEKKGTAKNLASRAPRQIRSQPPNQILQGLPLHLSPAGTAVRRPRRGAPSGARMRFAKLMKADGHGLRHEGLPGDDGWATTKGKGHGAFEWPTRR
ncbi:hypothetical protein MBLNU13_g06761t1 [Cladosporium sp. NU13]